MRLLLDTHIWLWSRVEPDRLTRAVLRRLEDPRNELWLSPMSVWETLVLMGRGRIGLDEGDDPLDWVDRALAEEPMREAPLNREVARAGWKLDLAHWDPLDRFIAASAVVYDLTLVTADRRLLESKQYKVLANR